MNFYLLTLVETLMILGVIGIVYRKLESIMSKQSDLDAAIDALPVAIKTAMEAALAPVIQAIIAKGTAASPPVDFQPEIDKLNAIPASVSSTVAADLTPAA